jgi:tyrosine-protein phosphatase YwqE
MLSLFRQKVRVPEIDFVDLGTDMHSHLIPGIDDGAQNLAQSIELIQDILDLGFRKIITTPHVMVDYYRNNRETITTGLTILKDELKRRRMEVEIEVAAEYYFDEGFENKIERRDILTLGDNYLLFEIPFSTYPINLFEVINKIIDNGYTPILAHPERYSYLHGSINNYRRIKDAGCYFQLNTISLTGYYGRPVQRMAEELVDSFLIDFLGSDMHHAIHCRIRCYKLLA